MQGRLISIVAASLLAGCAEPPSPPPVVVPTTRLGARFDAAKAGSIAGEVVWDGPLPTVAPFRSIPEPFTDQPPPPARNYANPNAPVIDGVMRTVSSAVVYLRRVDPERSRAWDLPPVRVELRDQQIDVMQGKTRHFVGFVRMGENVEFLSHDRYMHSIQGRGASFFARALPKPDEVQTRRLTTCGVVELQSGTGYFWMRGYLVVADHPYHVHTDTRGKFVLEDVPAGEYEIVAWHPDWRITQTLRNPDNVRVQQVTYRKPIEVSHHILVESGKTTTTRLGLSGH